MYIFMFLILLSVIAFLLIERVLFQNAMLKQLNESLIWKNVKDTNEYIAAKSTQKKEVITPQEPDVIPLSQADDTTLEKFINNLKK